MELFKHEQHYNPDMRHALKLHPDFRCAAVTHVEVEVARSRQGGLSLHYVVTGKITDLSLPPVGAPMRADELWRHTCFEAFVRVSPGDAYTEINFAPSRQWAAYEFNGYRSAMRNTSAINAPQIEVAINDESCDLRVQLDLDKSPNLPGDVLWDIGLAAVIEQKSGAKSYWALSHPPGEPDFHHSDCFALQIPPALRP